MNAGNQSLSAALPPTNASLCGEVRPAVSVGQFSTVMVVLISGPWTRHTMV
jgi:hypothetical protein